MMLQSLTTLLALGSMATAAPFAARQAAVRKLLVGGPGQILVSNFDGSSFEIAGKYQAAGTAPSWMRLRPSTKTLYAVDENSAAINQFALDAATDPTPKLATTINGSTGVVFLEFNQTRMVGAAYGSGMIDVYDVSTDTPSVLKSIKVEGTLGPEQTAHHPHQALLDPTGRFMVIPDLGGDQLVVLDTKDDKYVISSTHAVFEKAGPRHGGFITAGDKTYYTVACELSNKVVLYEVSYTDATIEFKEISQQSTYGAAFPPANATSAAAGELVVAGNNKDVYISHRVSGNETDSIAHFVFDAESAKLTFAHTVSTGGIYPRSMSLSDDEGLMFVANQGGESGLVALKRCNVTGSLRAEPVASQPLKELLAPGMESELLGGPQFVQEI